ncbi:DUF4037 domain-containing protein [Microbacterium sp.]|uniref:DUF4037 domain-containing protein n=1 Tax=Microbacterium sp. TaxID=51671 RepID=UPI0039E2D378
MDVHDWLSLTGHAVLEVIGGPVFADTTGQLIAVRDALRWYPEDLWRYPGPRDSTRAPRLRAGRALSVHQWSLAERGSDPRAQGSDAGADGRAEGSDAGAGGRAGCL